MKVKQKVETSGIFVEPDIKSLLMPTMIVCPECGNIIYPYEDDRCRVYYFPNMTNEHRYHTRHYVRAAFTCHGCGCKFSREANTYTELNWDKIKLDIAKVLMVLSFIILVLSAIYVITHDIRYDLTQLVVIILSWATFLGSLVYYWRNNDE